ncbi:MAG: hypothetical protein RL391_667 [Actinomycetota bacterium]|jgi:hypothetical protein
MRRIHSILLISSLVFAGCSSTSAAPESTAAPSSTEAVTTTLEETTTTVAPELPKFPLTGTDILDPTTADRPAIIVKIDNAPGARPQTGMSRADIVYEENVEQWTRFAAVFHSQGSDPVGPIRSGRTQDINLGTSLDRPLLVWSGGNNTVTSLINKSELVNMSVSAAGPNGGYYRSTDKKAPHNLFTKLSNIWALDEGRGGRPPAQFEYLEKGLVFEGERATGVKLKMDGAMKASWEWDQTSGTYLRNHEDKPHLEADGTRVSTNNVVVIVCEYKTSVADSRSPEAQTTGTGTVWVFSGGMFLEGTWSRADNRSPWVLTAADGSPIALTPGRTWVELIRDGQASVVPEGSDLGSVPWPGSQK